MNREQVLGILRHTLTFVGGFLVTKGLIEESQLIEITGAAVTLVGAIWSVLAKSNEEVILVGVILNGFREIMNLYSGTDSYFSKKRIESGIAFMVGQWGMIFFLQQNIQSMTASDIVLWAGVEFAISGYMLNHIQKKKMVDDEPSED